MMYHCTTTIKPLFAFAFIFSHPLNSPLTFANQKVYNIHHQMTHRADISKSVEYTAYSTGRELGQSCEHFSSMGSDPMESDGAEAWEKV